MDAATFWTAVGALAGVVAVVIGIYGIVLARRNTEGKSSSAGSSSSAAAQPPTSSSSAASAPTSSSTGASAPTRTVQPLPPPVVHAPVPRQTTTPAILPEERFPRRLADLGFEPRKVDGVEVIVPPLRTVPAGAFLMGSDPQRDGEAYDNERPQHSVTLGAYQISTYPVTVAEYACYVRAGRQEPRSQYNKLSWADQLKRLDHPVVNVSWNDAVAYATWLLGLTGQRWRLPTEAEWEKAARGTEGRIYPWGNLFEVTNCNTSASGIGTTTRVGTYPGGASPCGAQDMAGNVWEWTLSYFKPYPYVPGDEYKPPTSSGQGEPARVLRGGSWDSTPRYARAACRVVNRPVFTLDFNGFRVVVVASPGS